MNINELEQQLFDTQRELVSIQSDIRELLNAYSLFDDIFMALEELKRLDITVPRDLLDKIDEIARAVERRKD